MKKKTTLLKSLLLAAAVMTGTSAWAEVYPFTPSETTRIWADGKNAATDDADKHGDTNYYEEQATSWLCTQANISGGNLNNQNVAWGGSYAVITKFDLSKSKDLEGKNIKKATLSFKSVCTVASKNSNVIVSSLGTGWTASTVTWNSLDKAVTKISADNGQNVGTTEKTLSEDVTSLLSDDEDKVIAFAIYTYTAREQRISDIQLSVEAVDAASATTYSIEKYDTDGNLLETISSLVGEVAQTATIEDSYKTTFYNEDKSKKYVFDSENANNVTSKELVAEAASNVLKIYFKAYDKYTAAIKTVCGTNEVADITGSWYGDETPVTLYFPKAIKCEDGYYITDANAAEPLYAFTFSSTDLTKTVNYTLDESIVYYAKYQDLCGKVFSGNFFAEKATIGACKILTGANSMKSKMGLTEDGAYDITFVGGNRDSGHTTTLEVKLIDADNKISEAAVLSQYLGGGAWMGERTAYHVVIPAGSELYVANDNGEGNAKFAGDYVIVRKSPATTNVTITSEAEIATYVNGNYALDFSNVEGLTAWIVTGTDEVATLKQVTKVPAGTGIILQGAPTTYEVPVIAAADAIEGNLLKAAITETTAVKGDYVVAYKSDVCGFFPAEEELKIPAGKAYLHIDTEGGAPAFLPFAAETTGIGATLVNSEVVNNEIYNLAGQRVSQPTKGLYIVGGRKVVVK